LPSKRFETERDGEGCGRLHPELTRILGKTRRENQEEEVGGMSVRTWRSNLNNKQTRSKEKKKKRQRQDNGKSNVRGTEEFSKKQLD